MEKHNKSTFRLFWGFIAWQMTLCVSTGLICFGISIFFDFVFNGSLLSPWLLIYAYFGLILEIIILIWGAWTKNTNYVLMYMTVTTFINLDIAYYFAPDYTIATLQKMFPFLYWIN